MKVLLVSEFYPPLIFGGGEISSEILAKELVKKGIETHVLTSGHNSTKEESKDGIKVYRKLKTGLNPHNITGNIKRRFYFQKSLKKELEKLDKKEKYDVIHFLNTTSIPEFKVKSKAKKIATINGYTNFCPKRNLFYKEKTVCSGASFNKCSSCIFSSEYIGKTRVNKTFTFNPLFWIYLYRLYKKNNNNLKNIDQFIAVSDFIKHLLKKNGVNEDKIVKIPNLMEIKKSNNIKKSKEEKTIISYVGNLEKIKGVSLLVHAFNQIDNENSILLIVGGGSEKTRIKKIANKNVIFTGKVNYDNIQRIYNKTDIIVIPTLWPEPLSRVLLESTYHGKPIIATNTGGNSDGIIDNKNGFLINPNLNELKEKLETLIKNPRLVKNMGKHSKDVYKKRFDKSKIINKIIKIYEK